MLLGLLAVIQAIFLPGYLALRLSGSRTGSVVETAAISAALSLLINYLIVFALAILGVYGRTSTLILLAVELLLIAVLAVRDLRRQNHAEFRFLVPSGRQAGRLSTSLVLAAGTVFLLSVLAALAATLRFSVFDAWDALISWNEWAMVWFSGGVPQGVAFYPQLWPANISLMYHISGSPEMQSLPLGIVPWFGVAISAMFFDLAIRRRRTEYLVALLLTTIGLLAPSGSTFRGYADLPLTFMIVTVFYLLELRDHRGPTSWRQLALPVLIAGGAAVTKPNGLYFLAAVLAAAAAGHFAARASLTWRDWVKSGGLALLAVAAVPGSWYAVKMLDIAAGRDGSNAVGLRDAVDVAAGDSSLPARLVHSVTLFPGSWLTLAALVIAIALAVRVPRARWVALGILVPYTALWAVFLSYDLRNMLVMIPVIAYIAAFGIGGLAESVWKLDLGLRVREAHWQAGRRTILFAGLALVAGLAAVSAAYPTSRVIAMELKQQRLIGSPGLNRVLYSALLQGTSRAGDLLTDYGHLVYLPGFRNDPRRLQHSDRFRVAYAYQKSVTRESLENRDYLVLSDLVPREVDELVDQRLEDGSYSLLARFDSGPFMEYQQPVVIRVIQVNR
jgi:hypothetical protein